MDVRQESLQKWVLSTLPSSQYVPQGSLEVVSGDASFRRYFRQHVLLDGKPVSFIAVDAPPDKENSQSFVDIANAWVAQGINVPKVIKAALLDRDQRRNGQTIQLVIALFIK